ncbi:flagellar filament capping protein FliD [Pseudoduganella sp. FT25W]|uniref:Flagellar hook-associated protein 2 n=1 Tax=Duganella alba TaxID=2666081 RepID=A0A6L5QL57_9BURK|nr:flagellar filament capping protein FliD [Duganella alba]MRX10460.1 flagellar filament capping protein FliD [Duganella alba]MRX18080.1 flagellar filament capping protein FliD [Duganella alba]
MTTISNTTSSTSTGVTTDVYNRVAQTMAPATTAANKINASITKDQTKLSALGQLQSALASFQKIAAGLTGAGLSTTAASSAKNVLSATSTGTAKAGTYALDVKQLAQGQFLTSEEFATGTDGKVGSGATTTVKIDFGTTGGDKGFVTGAASASVTIDSSNNTPEGIAAAFKAAGVDVSVVKGDNGKYSLSIDGKDGAANSMRISVSGDAALKNLLTYDPTGTQKMKQTTAAQDAILTVDGKQITSASNTIKDTAIGGATLNLVGAGKSDVTIAAGASQIGDNLKSFVAAYNDLNAKMLKLQKGDLKSDTAMNQAVSQMSMLLKTGGGTVSVSKLAAAGITQDKDGNMVLDDKKLQAALTTDSSAVAGLFTTTDGRGIADLLSAKASALTSSSSVLTRETSLTTNEITNLNTKKASMTKALTAQANALAALYTAQAQTGAGSALNGTGSGTLFDMLG